MDHELKLQALSRLIESNTPEAQAALEREFTRAVHTLENEQVYDSIAHALDVIQRIGFTKGPNTLAALRTFIARAPQLLLAHRDDRVEIWGDIARYESSRVLIEKAIEALEAIRYIYPAGVFSTLLPLSRPQTEVHERALRALVVMAAYNIVVFYGNKQQKGIGAQPQVKLLDLIEALPTAERQANFFSLLSLAKEMLSPTMQGISSTHESVTFTSAAVPANSEVIAVRKRSIDLLKGLFGLATSVPERLAVVNTLMAATHTHHHGYDDDVLKMIMGNTVEVLNFYESILNQADLSVVQKIEHNSYWIFRRGNDREVVEAARRVETAIARNPEYQIYKVLIGFEGIQHSWKETNESEERFSEIEKKRERKAAEFATAITDDNFGEWRQRILNYATVEPNDLAIFPKFYFFLSKFARSRPALALTLLTRDAVALERFIVPIMRTLWKTDENGSVRTLLESWMQAGTFLLPSIQMFLGNPDLDIDVLRRLFACARQQRNLEAATLVVAVAVSSYRPGATRLISELFQPAVEFLTQNGDARWVNDFWVRNEARALVADLNDAGISAVLTNMLTIKDISYQAEEILYLIADKAPLKVLEFFLERLDRHDKKEKESGAAPYYPVPYEFHKLHEPLSRNVHETVMAIRSWHETAGSLFEYRGGRLLHNIFPTFIEAFQTELIALARRGSDKDLRFVAKILRTYEGNDIIRSVCKEIIKMVPEESDVLVEIAVALENTGVVSGEFGFVNAWEEKIERLREWLSDDSEKVRKFAGRLIDNLLRQVEVERKRVSEDVALRKVRYGE
jgi:hypothetical protein